MAKGAKGIRVNALAKELGIDNKVILEKCRQEGLADKVPNHQSTIALGLAETIKEWKESGALDELIKQFAGSSDSTAKKKKKAPARKKSADGSSDTDEGGVATLVEDETSSADDTSASGNDQPEDDAPESDESGESTEVLAEDRKSVV